MRTILQVGYPLAPVGPDAVGGVEQVMFQLERRLAALGYRTIVVAAEGSQVSGLLVPVPRVHPPYDEAAVAAARRHHAETIRAALARWGVDLVHMHGFDFDTYLPSPDTPVLATLHCPASWYAPQALHPTTRSVWLNAVSKCQHDELYPNDRLIGVVENGVPVESFSTCHVRRSFALVLARIAPEKGIREALEAARMADLPILIAGKLFPYPDHQRYFAQEIAPLLDRKRRYLGPVGFARKRRLLASARCVVIPSLQNETSSLVLREAFAAGTPVVAFRRGAMVEAIDSGRTGFLVDSVPEMAAAMKDAGALDADACRATARERFSLERMVEGYLDLYAEVIRRNKAANATLEMSP